MKFKLINFAGNRKMVDIPDNTKKVSGVILSGDMVMERPRYEDSNDLRFYDFYDGFWSVSAKDIERWNNYKDSAYAIFDFMDETTIKRSLEACE